MRGAAIVGLFFGTVAALVSMFWPASEPPAQEVPAATVEPSPQAPATSPRPHMRDCAGTVTNNPAIQDWRRSIGC